jgi:hypothetical protein
MDDLSDVQLAELAVGLDPLPFRPRNARELDFLAACKLRGEMIIYNRLVALIYTLPQTDPLRNFLYLWLRQQAEHLWSKHEGGRPVNDYKWYAVRRVFAAKVMANPGRMLKVLRGELGKELNLGKRQIAELTKGITEETAERIYREGTPSTATERWATPVVNNITDTAIGQIILKEYPECRPDC